MTARKLRLAALAARTRRLRRDTSGPAERALAFVIVAGAAADHAAQTVTATAGGNTAELSGTERVVSVPLEHLNQTRAIAQQ